MDRRSGVPERHSEGNAKHSERPSGQVAGLRALARRQSALAELGLYALEGHELEALMARASRVVADMLAVEYCKVLRLLPSKEALLLVAGVGWHEELIGSATVPAGNGSQAGYALEVAETVLEADISGETRFTSSPLLLDHGVRSGMSVVIPTPEGPYGILGAHTALQRDFSEDEAAFLQAVANILGEAVEGQRRGEALRRSEDRFRSVFENAAVGIAILGPDKGFIDVNQRLCTMLGYTRAELLRMSVEEISHPEDAGTTSEAIRALLETGTPSVQVEKRYLHKDSSVIWTDAAVAVARSGAGEVEYVVAALQDVTARKLAEEAREAALRQEERARQESEAANERLRFLADAGHLLAGSLDYQETLSRLARLAVPRLADWCAVDILTEEGVLKRLAVAHKDPERVLWAQELHRRFPPDPSAPRGGYHVVRSGKPEFYPEIDMAMLEDMIEDEELLEIMRQVGFSSAISVPLSSRGRTLGVLSLVHAESGRSYGEFDLQLATQLGERAGVAVDNAQLFQSVRALNTELEARVLERTEELVAANAELEAFTYSTSHDLRTPLRGINGFSQALLEDYGEALDDTAKRYLERIQAGAVRMDELIDDLLALSRISRSEVKKAEVDLSRLVDGIAAALQEAEPGRRVEVQIQPGLRACCDEGLIRVVFENLLANAWKFTRQQRDARISFGSEERDGETVYVVADNGAGFEMAYADKLFLPFQRLHSPHDFEGSGIGLATVDRVVRKHGGRIWAEGSKGQGAAFYLTLPPG